MPIQFRCDQCARTLSIGSHKAGSTIHCPVCLALMPVPRADPLSGSDDGAPWRLAAPAPTATPIPAWPRRAEEPPSPRKRPAVAESAKPNRLPRLAANGVILGVMLLAVLIAVAAIPRESNPSREEDARQEFAANLVASHSPAPPVEKKTSVDPSPLPPTTLRKLVKSKPAESVKSAQKPAHDPVKEPVPSPGKGKAVEAKSGDRIMVKRRVGRSEDELVRQINHVQELMLDRTLARAESVATVKAAQLALATGRKNADTTLALLDHRPDLAGLPFRRGDACRSTPASAGHLEGGSIALREVLSSAAVMRAVGTDRGPTPPGDATRFSRLLMGDKEKCNKWLRAEAVPALVQLLMAEKEAIREVLIDQLARIEGKGASEALARRALFDLHPRVREQALAALARRPAGEYRHVLLKGFSHPWPVVAEHAAEAVVALKGKEMVPALLEILDKPDPRAPYEKPGGKVRYVKEMVRVNHLMNCLLCHPPSLNASDRVRGRVPRTDEEIPKGRAYHEPSDGTFVRADVTYLKQDFSTLLPVANPGKWPASQRFDFILRERVATARDLKASIKRRNAGPTEQQRSTFFALRELTGKDPGPTVEDWKKLVLGGGLEVRLRYRGFPTAEALAVDVRANPERWPFPGGAFTCPARKGTPAP